MNDYRKGKEGRGLFTPRPLQTIPKTYFAIFQRPEQVLINRFHAVLELEWSISTAERLALVWFLRIILHL